MGEKETHDFTEEQVLGFNEAFNIFDTDRDGTITSMELGTVMKNLGKNPTEEELSDMINEFDRNRNGTVDFEEFLLMMSKQMKENDSDDELREVFKVFDQNGDGFINVEELMRVLTSLGEILSEEDVKMMIKEADNNGDGLVDCEKFIVMTSEK